MALVTMHHLATIFRLFNLPDEHAQESFARNVARYMIKIRQALRTEDPASLASEYPIILDRIWQATHIRSQLFELMGCDIPDSSTEATTAYMEHMGNIARALQEVCMGGGSLEWMLERMNSIFDIYPGAYDYMTLAWSATRFDADPEDRFAWVDHAIAQGRPLAIYRPRDHQQIRSQSALLSKEGSPQQHSALLSGQRAAFEDLSLMLQARKECLSAGGITPRLHALIIGPSGSGKTHVVRAFARAQRLPLYEQSAASWQPNGSKAIQSTPVKIAQFVESNKEGILFIDEVEKSFPPDLLQGSTWERANADELMSLLDAKVDRWEGWSTSLARRLDKHFFIILSGAWQAAYQAAFKTHRILGGDWTNLSIADSFLESNHLPQELLNRVSTKVIEILPPTREELKAMVLSVQRDLGMQEDEKEALDAAKEIVEERKGVRGVESYMLQRWMRIQREVPLPRDLPMTDLRSNETHPSQPGDSAESVA